MRKKDLPKSGLAPYRPDCVFCHIFLCGMALPVCCSVLQCVAVCCSVWIAFLAIFLCAGWRCLCVDWSRRTYEESRYTCVAVCCVALWGVAGFCRVVQCVEVCCCVLLCVNWS